MIDVQKIRSDFPQLKRKIHNKPIVYLDSTATSLKPQSVIDALDDYYKNYSANIFRGIYVISEEATAKYEQARQKVADFIGAREASEVVFTRNATESINLVAYAWGMKQLKDGDEMVTTIMEHHSNFVPWQQLAMQKGNTVKIWNVGADGQLDISNLDTLITRKTKLLAITALSNVLGTIVPIKEIVQKVKKSNPQCVVVVDAAQAVPHMRVDVLDWGADFVVFSSHKMLGPTGVGVLWGKRELLDNMNPFMYGGEMIQEVQIEKTFFKQSPHKFEAGTPHIAGVLGLGAAIDYLTDLGMDNVRNHEQEIVAYAMEKLAVIDGIRLHGPRDLAVKGGVIAFTIPGVHAHDIAQILDEDNICIRSGNHCAMPLHAYLNVAATARASFYVYTTPEDIDSLVLGLLKAQKKFK
jgi:cysteine desulfurase/selenocysteine lyase